MGRSYWGDVIRNTRTLGRLIWFHVPPRVSPKTAEEIQSGTLQRSEEEMNKVMAEKRMALDLLEGYVRFDSLCVVMISFECRFSVALKHHLRGKNSSSS